MYFLVKGECNATFDGTFEWVLEADNKEEALKQLEEGEKVVEIREISVEERIEFEKKDLIEIIKWDYLYRKCGSMSIREFSKIQKELDNSLEMQYLAIKEFNAKQRLTKRLSRQEGFNNMTMAEFNEKINQLIYAKDEEEFNKILRGIQKK